MGDLEVISRLMTVMKIEIKDVFNGMALDKAPGLDGLSVEFYQRYWDIIGMDVTAAVDFFFATGKMPDSWKATFITLILR